MAKRCLFRWNSWHIFILIVIISTPFSSCVFTSNSITDYAISLRFTKRLYNVSIPENSAIKTYVHVEEKMGIPCGSKNLEIRYKIISGNRDKFFKADERYIGGFWFLLIRTSTGNVDVLNRERKDQYNLVIKASIKNKTTKHAIAETECSVFVTVLDTNDINPMFFQNEYETTVTEDTPVHSTVIKVSAEDADLGINGEIYYSFQDMTEQFAIHPSTGIVTLTRPLRFTDKSVYDLVILAKDRGPEFKGNANPPSAKLKITVKQVNLFGPEIYVHHLPVIVEQSNADIYAIVRLTDRDSGVHGEIDRLVIVDGDPYGHFRIKPSSKEGNSTKNEYNIEVLHLLDRETAPDGYNLTLMAVDKGTPPRRTFKSVSVHLADINDNAPVFDREVYEVNISETAPINSPIVRVKVTDLDQGKNADVAIEIVGGNEGKQFRINSATGMLYTAVQLDAEVKSFYSLTVGAIDQGNVGSRKQSAAKIKVNVVDANDNSPLFDTAEMEVYVNENEPGGTSVIKVTAHDKDSGENAYISYSIANLMPVPFAIDYFSGVVKTTQVLDYESSTRDYILKIRASDWGSPYRRETEMQLKIKVRDVNDNRPQFEKVDCIGHIPRNIAIGREIITLSAIDFDSGNIISYRIVSGNEDSCFSLDSSSGIISVTCDLSDLLTNERELNVTATDSSHFSDTAKIKINLIDAKHLSDSSGKLSNADDVLFECRDTGVARRLAELLASAEKNNRHGSEEEFAMMPIRYGENVHAPEFINFPSQISVNESEALGNTILKVECRDRDLGFNGKLIYGISSGDDDSVFRLDPENGKLKLVGYLDRERTKRYSLNITVYDLGTPQKRTSRILDVIILDVNDNAPKFQKNLGNLRVSEKAANGSIIYKVNATDADEGKNAMITYSLVSDTEDFCVEPLTGEILICMPLDRERQDYYELVVRATDGASDTQALHSDALFRVTVNDVNDNAPNFTLPSYVVRIREDVPIGTVVSILSAKDPDLGPGGEVRYLIVNQIDSDNVFSVDELTGTVRVSKLLDFEERQIHSLIVRAKDAGSPSLSSETTLIVEVIDVNENYYAPEFDDFVVSYSIAENQPPGTEVATVDAVDDDIPGDDSRVGYTIREGDGLGYFSIDNEGVIRTLTTLDCETKSSYWITIYAHDHAVVPLHSILHVHIQVTNVNDNVPLTSEPSYYPHVKETSAVNTTVLQLNAFDADLDSNQKITFAITDGNLDGLFAIDRYTGIIKTTGNKLDREKQSEHMLEVSVSDNGTPSLTSTTRVTIVVDDINDNSPYFDKMFYLVKIPETRIKQVTKLQNVTSDNNELTSDISSESDTWESFIATNITGEPLFRIIARDLDTGVNGMLYYSLKHQSSTKGLFAIHPQTGIIYSNKTFVAGEKFEMQVKATDGGSPPLSATTMVNMVVQAVPPNGPNHKPVIKPQLEPIEITESDSVGYFITLIEASDEDGDFLWYKIEGGDNKAEFMINEGGSLLIAKQLDYEVENKYNITISATDGLETTYTQLCINVVDINEHRPTFSTDTFYANVSENLQIGSLILKLNATDLDHHRMLFYTIHNARCESSLNMFHLDYNTGVLSSKQQLDRESISQHVLTVMVRDEGTPSNRNFARVIIDVYDANDHAPEFSVSIMQAKVFETAAVGTTVLQVYAVDKDHGDNAAITYHISSGNVGNIFSIDEKLGIIEISKEFDSNSQHNEYLLNVKATDMGSVPLSSSLTVHIMVVMADNAPPRFTKSEISAEIYENEPTQYIVTHLEARSTSSLVFEIINGNDDSFEINPSTGTVTTKRILDYELKKLYNITVTATNMAGAKATCQVIVHILDRNDNNPEFTILEYEGTIMEAAPIGSLILTLDNHLPLVLKAKDDDSELNSLLHYEVIESNAKRMFHIVSNTGAIKTIVTLDYETLTQIDFHVRVNDHGKPRLTSETLAHVKIHIQDINDCTPVFSKPGYNTTVILPTYQNVAIIQLNATDGDSSNLTKLQYSIIDGNLDNVYEINEETGLITIRDASLGSKSSLHRLKVSVTDGQFSSESVVNVKWEKPENSELVFQRTQYQGVVAENSTKIMTVAVVNVIGSALNENLLFSILNPSEYFKIGSTSGAIRTTGIPFDRELQEYHQLIVQAKSEEENDNGKRRIAHAQVNVTVLDENDNCPMFVNLPYYAVVSVDAHRSDVITKVHAVDLDKGENGHVRYELVKGQGEIFKVDRKSGEISLKQILEGHNREYQLTIAAYDGGTPPCSTEVAVNLKVVDKSMPVFDKQFYAVSVAENMEIHVPLSISINAESPLSRKLIYSITSGNTLEQFAIDFNTGGLYVVDQLDYEREKEYALTVRATDSVSGVFAEVLVNVLVTDVNDCPPEFQHDSYNVTVSEAATFGSLIIKVLANDCDSGVNKMVKYSIRNDSYNSTDNFHIDADDGNIYLKRSLDREYRTYHHFIIEATDSGFPSLSSSAHVWVTVLDVNDNAPKFDQTSYTSYLSEDATREQFVAIIMASDPDIVDQGHLTYNIVGGNQQQIFYLNTNTGIIQVVNLQKLSDSSHHLLNVSVSDGVYTSFARVRIEITSSNKYPPIFEQIQYEARVSENQPPGVKIIQVKAIDKNFGQYGQISYNIPSQTLSESFYINNVTGEILTKTVLDREVKISYEITVMAIDGGGLIGSTIVRVTVIDVNDNAPEFLLSEYKSSINSNLVTDSFFLKVRATDKDDGLNSLIQYSIYETQGKGANELFAINKQTGGIQLVKSAKYYENQVFQFFVRASDRGTPSLYSDVPVDIYIMSSKDVPPVFERIEDKFFFSEGAPIGSVITKMKLVTNVTANYKLISRSDSFSMDNEGQITLTSPLNREKDPYHIIGVIAYTDSSPPLTALSEIFLQILDDNDNNPIFDNDVYTIAIAEDIPTGSSIMRVHAKDADEGKNAEIKYSIETNMADVFAVEAYSGWITTLVSLDREKNPSFVLNIVAKDNGTPSLSDRTQLHISLIDYNDNPSNFTQDVYSATVKEDALAGTVVTKLSLSDADSEIPSTISFFIISGNPYAQFSVRNTGEVYVSGELDRELINEYELSILATEGKFESKTTLKVSVTDVNDERPYCLRHRYRQSFLESTPTGSFVLSILATDADLDPKLRFYLTGVGAEYFTLDRNTGEMKIARSLDRETQSKYELIAHVQDREHVDWECQSQVEINVLDVNDNAPIFIASNNTVAIPEDADIGTLVTKVHASDADIGLNRRVRYSMVDSANGHFVIAPESGIMTLARLLDRETKETYNLTIKAMDQGIPQLSTLASIIVVVLDVNDNPPEFVYRTYSASVSEDAAIGTEVSKIQATSLDTGINAEIFYTIEGGNEHGKFAIDAETGVITLHQPVDYERVREYLLTIQATDKGEPPLSNQVPVNITIIDANDNSPVFTQMSYSAMIPEDIPIGDIVTKVQATDFDSEDNGKVIYSIERGDRHQQFAIDSVTGHVTVARPLDREMISSYTLQIRATDNGLPELSSFTIVSVDVSDINDNPPVFSSSNYTCVIQEDKRLGWPVCQVNVTDADITPNGPPFVFDIISGNIHSAFRIDKEGVVRTASRLKNKVQEIHELRIRVFDNGSPMLYSDGWLTIKVIEESQFAPLVTPLEIWVGSYQDRWTGGELGRIHATDEDEYDILLYNVLLPHQGLFNIDERTGVLTAAPGLDTGQYTLNISVTDGKFTSYTPVKVNVDALYEDMLLDAVSIRLRSVTPHHFLLNVNKNLIKTLKSSLLRDVRLISIQEAPQGHLDILLIIKGGIELGKMHEALQTIGLNAISFPCNCVRNQGSCKQRLSFQPEHTQIISTDVVSFVSPSHSQQLYCACFVGFIGTRCENELPMKCSCPDEQQCIYNTAINASTGYRCISPPIIATSCEKNTSCSDNSSTSIIGFYTFSIEQVIGLASLMVFLVFVICIILLCRKCKRTHRRVPTDDKSLPVLNSAYKRNSKISNLEITQGSMRPLSYTPASGNGDLYVAATQLNNLDTLRSYGSAGDELENVPVDYLRNLNRKSNVASHKITNDLKKIPECTKLNKGNRKSLSCVEDAKLLGGYHWDCSDWVRRSQNPLPNITEVPGSEIPDSSSFYSNGSNESRYRRNIPLNSSQELGTLDEEAYMSYRSDDDEIVAYGFPHSTGYPSQSDLSTNVCEIDDSDAAL